MTFFSKINRISAMTAFLCIVSVINTSCKKDVYKFDSNYEGLWISLPITPPLGEVRYEYFEINGEYGKFGEDCDSSGANCANNFSGKAKMSFGKNKFTIGSLNKNGQIIMEVDIKPHLNSFGQWECTLTSHTFIRQ